MSLAARIMAVCLLLAAAPAPAWASAYWLSLSIERGGKTYEAPRSLVDERMGRLTLPAQEGGAALTAYPRVVNLPGAELVLELQLTERRGKRDWPLDTTSVVLTLGEKSSVQGGREPDLFVIRALLELAAPGETPAAAPGARPAEPAAPALQTRPMSDL
ncbi:MAG TPA: hypothetical protein VFV27_05380 [Nevskiaceae bacterium]|nr:hypothetical protein [Nevskiaceae bacterium]